MIPRALISALVAASFLTSTVFAAPGRDPNADQGEGYLEAEYGVGTCEADAPVSDTAPSSSDCGHVNADAYGTQAGSGS